MTAAPSKCRGCSSAGRQQVLQPPFGSSVWLLVVVLWAAARDGCGFHPAAHSCPWGCPGGGVGLSLLSCAGRVVGL